MTQRSAALEYERNRPTWRLDPFHGCTETLHLDADRNPYNNNDVGVISTHVVASATGGAYAQNTVNWNTTGMTNGTTVYVYAQVTDGTRTRCFYVLGNTNNN